MLSGMCCSGKRSPRLLRWMQTEINLPQTDAKKTALHHLQHIRKCADIRTQMCSKHEEDMMRLQNSNREIQRGPISAVKGHIQRIGIWENKSGSINRYLRQNRMKQEGSDITGAVKRCGDVPGIRAKQKKATALQIQRCRWYEPCRGYISGWFKNAKNSVIRGGKRARSSAALAEAEITSALHSYW